MKPTGIVRRIDDLGRVVIPKELRRSLRIKEGDPLEIYTDRDGEVIFKKYSPIGELAPFAVQYVDALHRASELIAAICDRDAVIACAGAPKRELMDKAVSSALSEIVESRNLFVRGRGGAGDVFLLEENESWAVNCAMPILAQGDVLGCVLTLSPAGQEHAVSDIEVKLIQTAGLFLGKQMET